MAISLITTPFDDAVSDALFTMRDNIDLLYDYVRGHMKGLDIIDCAERIKRDSDVIFKVVAKGAPSPKKGNNTTSLRSVGENENENNEALLTNATDALLSLRAESNGQDVKYKNSQRHSTGKRGRPGRPPKRSNPFLTGKIKKKRIFAKREMSYDDFKVLYGEIQGRGGIEVVCSAKHLLQVAKCIRSDDELKNQTSAGSDLKKIWYAHEHQLREEFG